MDEVHERDVLIDFLMIIIRDLLPKRFVLLHVDGWLCLGLKRIVIFSNLNIFFNGNYRIFFFRVLVCMYEQEFIYKRERESVKLSIGAVQTHCVKYIP